MATLGSEDYRHYLQNPEYLSYPRSYTTNILPETRVRAAKFIAKNVCTRIIDNRDFGLESPANITHDEVCEVNGVLESVNSVSNSVWIKLLNIGIDHNLVNVELEVSHDGLYMKTIRDINPGEPLFLWFGYNIRNFLNIPYLNSSNIYETMYKCHVCYKLFHWPNSLSIHLALRCDTMSLNTLWRYLATEVLTPQTALETYTYPTPYSNYGLGNLFPSTGTSPYPIYPYPIYPRYPNPMSEIDPNALSYSLRYVVYDPVVMENEASNNGRTEDGRYQCRICLKKYSRKHGLKIHFRIHTGYKPLKCKICSRAFGDPSNLNKHIRLHTKP